MKKDDLVKIIRAIVKQELKKELPNALAQVFSQMMGQAQSQPIPKKAVKPVELPSEDGMVDETSNLKAQLQEMFAGGTPVQKAKPQAASQPKRFTKDPMLNEILNQTRGFNSSERMANRVGGMGGMSPAVAMAASGYESQAVTPTGAGEMMEDTELRFLNAIPGMPGADTPVVSHLPVGHARVHEGQEGGPAPLEALGAVSALDLKNHPALPDSIKGILTRDYRSLVRAMDRKK